MGDRDQLGPRSHRYRLSRTPGRSPPMGVHVRWSPPPCASPSAPKVDRLCLCSDCIHMLWLKIDHPDALSPLGSRVATTTGWRRRGLATWGGSPRDSKRDAVLRACRALSVSLGLSAENVGGVSHAPTPNAVLCRASVDLCPPMEHWPPHSEERSDQLRHAGPLRGPPRVDVPILSSQSGKTCPAVAWVLKLPG